MLASRLLASVVMILILFLSTTSCSEPESGPRLRVVFEWVGEGEPPLSELETRLRNRLTERGATDLAMQILEPSTLQLTFADRAGQELSSWLDLVPVTLEVREIQYPPGVRDFAGWRPPNAPEIAVSLFGEQLPEDTVLLPQLHRYPDGQETELQWPVHRSPIVAGADLLRAEVAEEWPFEEPRIAFDLTETAGHRMEQASQRNVGRMMAFVLREGEEIRVMSTPQIMAPIGRTSLFGGVLEGDDAEILALRMELGALISGFRIVEKSVVGGQIVSGGAKIHGLQFPGRRLHIPA